jgi:maleylpyruvate isomerase
MSLAVPLTHLAELADSEARLGADLASHDQTWAQQPSALPGWSRAHVVAHLTGNAEGMCHLVSWATTGVETPMYPSPEERAAGIERRAGLAWPELRAEQDGWAKGLAETLEGLVEPVAERQLRLGSGAPVNVCDLAAVRVREIEIHRVDLAADYRAEQWTPRFTVRTLSQVAGFFAAHRDVPVQLLRASDTGSCWRVGTRGPDLMGTEADLLAWLLGRPNGPITATDGVGLPSAPTWV